MGCQQLPGDPQRQWQSPAQWGHLRHARAFATRTPNLLNVAVTRARRRPYVIGDRAAWANEPHFDVLARNLSAR
jgi:hypothetical protein